MLRCMLTRPKGWLYFSRPVPLTNLFLQPTTKALINSSSSTTRLQNTQKVYSTCPPANLEALEGKCTKDVFTLLDSPPKENLGLEAQEDANELLQPKANKNQLRKAATDLIEELKTGTGVITLDQITEAMAGAATARAPRLALAVFDAARAAPAARGLPPLPEETYVLALRALGCAANGRRALALFAELQWVGLPPQAPTYAALLDVLARARMPAEARAALAQMTQRAAGGLGGGGGGGEGGGGGGGGPLLAPGPEHYAAALRAHLPAPGEAAAAAAAAGGGPGPGAGAGAAVGFLEEVLRADPGALTPGLFRALLAALGEAGEWRAAVDLYDWASSQGDGKELELDVPTTMLALKACARAGLWEAGRTPRNTSAWSVLQGMREAGAADAAAYNVLVDAVCESEAEHRRHAARHRRKQLRNGPPGAAAAAEEEEEDRSGRTTPRHRRRRRPAGQPSLFDLLALMHEEGVPADAYTYNTALKGCASWEDAEPILGQMAAVGLKPDTQTFNTLMGLCAEEGKCAQALKLLEQLKTAEDAEPDQRSYTTAIVACREDGRWRAALRLLGEMGARGLPPDTAAANAALSALGRAGRPHEALALLQQLQADGAADRVSYNTALHALARAGRAREALALLQQLQAEGLAPDGYTWTAALSAAAHPGAGAAAGRALAAEALEGLRGGGGGGAAPMDGRHLLLALQAFGRAGAYHEAQHAVLELLPAATPPPPGAAARRRRRGGGGGEGGPAAAGEGGGGGGKGGGGEGEEAAFRLRCHNLALKAAARSARPELALRHLWALAGGEHGARLRPDAVSYNTVMTAYRERKHNKDLLELFAFMKDQGVEPDLITYNNVFTALSTQGRAGTSVDPDGQRSLQLFEEMLDQGLTPTGLTISLLMGQKLKTPRSRPAADGEGEDAAAAGPPAGPGWGGEEGGGGGGAGGPGREEGGEEEDDAEGGGQGGGGFAALQPEERALALLQALDRRRMAPSPGCYSALWAALPRASPMREQLLRFGVLEGHVFRPLAAAAAAAAAAGPSPLGGADAKVLTLDASRKNNMGFIHSAVRILIESGQEISDNLFGNDGGKMEDNNSLYVIIQKKSTLDKNLEKSMAESLSRMGSSSNKKKSFIGDDFSEGGHHQERELIQDDDESEMEVLDDDDNIRLPRKRSAAGHQIDSIHQTLQRFPQKCSVFEDSNEWLVFTVVY